jgi:hypothetical protein
MIQGWGIILMPLYLLGLVKSIIVFANMIMTPIRPMSGKIALIILWSSFLAAGHSAALLLWNGPEGSLRVAGSLWFGAFILLSLLFLLDLIRNFRRSLKTLSSVSSRDITRTLRPAPTRSLFPHPYPLLPNEQFYPRFVDHEVWFPDLPAKADGMSFLHISDIHFVQEHEHPYFRQLLKWIVQLKTREILVTGDLVSREADIPACAAWLADLTRSHQVYAVLGNHDYWTDPVRLVSALRRSGVRVLRNESIPFGPCRDCVHLVGLDDLHKGKKPSPDLWDRDRFQIVMAHTPDALRLSASHGADLQLSGHTHAGQIRLPFLGALLVPSIYSRRYDHGFFRVRGMVLCVTSGIGGLPPIRLNCRPEVLRMTLRRGTLK